MNKLFFALCLFSMNLTLAQSATAAIQYKKGEPFVITGIISHYYGFNKSAEAIMWANALQICENISKGENNGLVLNRLSKIVIKRDHFESIAQATFICLPVGLAR